MWFCFFFSSRRRHTRCGRDWSSDVCSSDLKQELRTWAKDDPIDALLLTAFGGGIAFYLVERGKNPNIQTPWDAILYVATCFSVGYDNTFPVTDAGHALATMVQTFGPAMAGQALNPPASEPDEALEV